MAENISGNHDGKNGRNESYFIPGRGNVPRKKLVKEVLNGQHPKFGTYKREGEDFVRAKPDKSKKNNVNNVK